MSEAQQTAVVVMGLAAFVGVFGMLVCISTTLNEILRVLRSPDRKAAS